MNVSLQDILSSHRTGRTAVMGVLNITPDSFSDGGKFFDAPSATARAAAMAADGADIIDIGAESTRSGSDRISASDQIDRLASAVAAGAGAGAVVSIDTTSSIVAAYALDQGASIINDISAGRDDPDIFALAAQRRCGLVLMHMLGDPATMQRDPRYDDVVAEVRDFLASRIAAAVAAGVAPEQIIVDPGIGFGKRLDHNLALLRGLGSLRELGRPILVGASRKRFIGEISGVKDASARQAGSVAAALYAAGGGATILRVHDVAATCQALAVWRSLANPPKSPA
ncbi:MAG: dihydropteroate synthase [Planctomycetaceae bacterium]|nr:dihydropteroate synthase [Planctomycetaceae bacterium]